MEAELSMIEENDEEEVTKEQEELLRELKRSSAALQAEVDLFERFISRTDPHDLLSQTGGGGPGGSQLEGGGRGRRRRSRSHVSDRLQQLSLEQKLYVARREVTDTQQDREKVRLRRERIQDEYKASLQEAEMRLSDIRRAQSEFERRLLKPLKDNRLDMKQPEKLLHAITDKSKVSQLEKFVVKNQALKLQEKKLQQQLLHRREAAEAEREDVFQEFTVHTVHRDLEPLQVHNLKVQRVLSSQKEKLQSVTRESTELSNDITHRKQILEKMEAEIQHAQEEQVKAETLNQHLRRQITDYQAPGVEEYILIKDRHKKLQQTVHMWERKVRIAEMSLTARCRAWNTQRNTLTPANSAAAGARSGQHRLPVKLPHIAEHVST